MSSNPALISTRVSAALERRVYVEMTNIIISNTSAIKANMRTQVTNKSGHLMEEYYVASLAKDLILY